jgi:dihydroorotase
VGRRTALVAAPYASSLRVNPPLRSVADAAACREALLDGTADAIATDHAPHASVDKDVEFGLAANGISGIETALGVVLAAVDAGLMPLSRARALLSTGPRGCSGRLGSARPGSSKVRRPTSSCSTDRNVVGLRPTRSGLAARTRR